MQDLFTNEIVLENSRVVLQPLLLSDMESIEKISYTEGLWEFGARVKCRSDLEKYFEYCLGEKEAKRLYPFVIFDKEYNAVAGVTMFGEYDSYHKRVEIGWTWIGLLFQGTGLNVACKNLLIDYAFRMLGVRRVQFKVDIKNTKSQRAVQKLGAVKEGLLRNYNLQSYGESEGTFVYSILKEEWMNSTTTNLA